MPPVVTQRLLLDSVLDCCFIISYNYSHNGMTISWFWCLYKYGVHEKAAMGLALLQSEYTVK